MSELSTPTSPTIPPASSGTSPKKLSGLANVDLFVEEGTVKCRTKDGIVLPLYKVGTSEEAGSDLSAGFFQSRKIQIFLVTATMALIPMCLAAAMVFVGKVNAEQWLGFTWKLFMAGMTAPSTGAILGRAWEGVAASKKTL
jgi:hypothetical protein